MPIQYLVHWLTGCYSTDYSDATGTLMLDVKSAFGPRQFLISLIFLRVFANII